MPTPGNQLLSRKWGSTSMDEASLDAARPFSIAEAGSISNRRQTQQFISQRIDEDLCQLRKDSNKRALRES